MNKIEAEKMLASARVDLEGMRQEYEALQKVIAGLQEWLGVHGANPNYAKTPKSVHASQETISLSLRQGILQVLRESGESLHSKEIYKRATALGVSSKAKNPLGIVDLTLIGFIEKGIVEKTAPRTYRFLHQQ